MAAVALLAAPVVAPAAAVPEEVLPQAGNLDNRELTLLRISCLKKHDEQGEVLSRILTLASFVAGLFAAIVIPGFMGLFIGGSIYFVGGNLLCQTYHGLRNRDLLDVGQALSTKSFKEYITQKELEPTIDTILVVFKEFKAHVAARLHAARDV